jgi:energy-coupling factor transporter transmembrane protein EcfT
MLNSSEKSKIMKRLPCSIVLSIGLVITILSIILISLFIQANFYFFSFRILTSEELYWGFVISLFAVFSLILHLLPYLVMGSMVMESISETFLNNFNENEENVGIDLQ